jgi:hypothetical protein
LRQPVHHDLMASSSKGLPTLSKLSFPDNFSEVPIVDALTGAEVTPESRVPCQVRRLGGGVYVVQASWSMEDHGSVEELA